MEIKNLFQSKRFKIALFVVAGVITALLIFQAGVFVGYRRASFSYNWGDNYYRAFSGRRGGEFMMGVPTGMGRDFFNPHGATGKIIKVDLPTLMIIGSDNIERAVVINNDTVVTRFRENIKPFDLKVNDFVVIIGSPDEKGEMNAKLIRVMPVPAEFSTNPNSFKPTSTAPTTSSSINAQPQ